MYPGQPLGDFQDMSSPWQLLVNNKTQQLLSVLLIYLDDSRCRLYFESTSFSCISLAANHSFACLKTLSAAYIACCSVHPLERKLVSNCCVLSVEWNMLGLGIKNTQNTFLSIGSEAIRINYHRAYLIIILTYLIIINTKYYYHTFTTIFIIKFSQYKIVYSHPHL